MNREFFGYQMWIVLVNMAALSAVDGSLRRATWGFFELATWGQACALHLREPRSIGSILGSTKEMWFYVLLCLTSLATRLIFHRK